MSARNASSLAEEQHRGYMAQNESCKMYRIDEMVSLRHFFGKFE